MKMELKYDGLRDVGQARWTLYRDGGWVEGHYMTVDQALCVAAGLAGWPAAERGDVTLDSDGPDGRVAFWGLVPRRVDGYTLHEGESWVVKDGDGDQVIVAESKRVARWGLEDHLRQGDPSVEDVHADWELRPGVWEVVVDCAVLCEDCGQAEDGCWCDNDEEEAG